MIKIIGILYLHSCWDNCIGGFGADVICIAIKDRFHHVQWNLVCLASLLDDLWNLLCHLSKRNHENCLCISWSCHFLHVHCSGYPTHDGWKAQILYWSRRICFCNSKPLPWYHQSFLDDPFIGWKRWPIRYQRRYHLYHEIRLLDLVNYRLW